MTCCRSPIAGWLLENRERHIFREGDTDPADPELAVLLKQSYDLIDQPRMADLFEDEHPEGAPAVDRPQGWHRPRPRGDPTPGGAAGEIEELQELHA